MNYGLCDLSIVGIRSEPSDKSELISQILYGECFKLIEKQKKWSRIKLFYDDYEGWIDNKQYRNIDEKTYIEITNQTELFSSELEAPWILAHLLRPKIGLARQHTVALPACA